MKNQNIQNLAFYGNTMKQYDLILSLTTWTGRIDTTGLKFVLMSMLKQETKANYKVVLVLSEDEFVNKNIPSWLVELEGLVDNFEILWTKENTRAYKKYFPTRRKYPDENICALDDDSPLHSNFVETMVSLLEKFPDRYILGINPSYRNVTTINSPRYACACYRPDSLYPNYDELWGRKYFKDHDDEFYKLLAVLNGSHYVPVNMRNYIDIDKFNQNVKLSTLGNTQYGNLGSMWVKCFNENPELGRLFNKNKNIKN